MSYFAEQNVVGSLLMDGDAIERVAAILEPEMFTAELLGLVYLEYLRGYENGYTVNLVTVRERLGGDKYPGSVVAEALKECVSDGYISPGQKLCGGCAGRLQGGAGRKTAGSNKGHGGGCQ